MLATPRIFDFERVDQLLADADPLPRRGRVLAASGHLISIELPGVRVGQQVVVGDPDSGRFGEVVAVEQRRATVMPYTALAGISAGMMVEARPRADRVAVGPDFLGRVIDPTGVPLDSGPAPIAAARYPLRAEAPNPLTRRPITTPMPVGVRAVDALCTIGEGQRVGIFAGSGVGKSTLLGMMARHAKCDAVVIALVGERGREVREFIERDLGGTGAQRSAMVVATSDRSPVLRVRAAEYAVALAENLRDRGQRVLFLMDSVTRYAHALREVGLASGEPPATRGYPPSVFAALPALLERLGTCEGRGSITAFVTVLVEGDDLDEPISDTVRGVLDGHLVLSRSLAEEGIWPALDPLVSLSRLAVMVTDPEHQAAAQRLRSLLARYRQSEELIRLGAYIAGSDAEVDFMIERRADVLSLLCQGAEEVTDFDTTITALHALLSEAPS
jgi:flagellum-specific ATP synthase